MPSFRPVNTSDFDLGIFVNEALSYRERNSLMERLDLHIQQERQVLISHGVIGDLSVQFFRDEMPESTPPAILFSLAIEGQLLWEKVPSFFEAWKKSMKQLMRKKEVKSSGSYRRTYIHSQRVKK